MCGERAEVDDVGRAAPADESGGEGAGGDGDGGEEDAAGEREGRLEDEEEGGHGEGEAEGGEREEFEAAKGLGERAVVGRGAAVEGAVAGGELARWAGKNWREKTAGPARTMSTVVVDDGERGVA